MKSRSFENLGYSWQMQTHDQLIPQKQNTIDRHNPAIEQNTVFAILSSIAKEM